MFKLVKIITPAFLLICLVNCGQKGPLYIQESIDKEAPEATQNETAKP